MLDKSHQYRIDTESLKIADGELRATVVGGSSSLNLAIMVNTAGSVRVRLTESTERWQPHDILLPLIPGIFTVLPANDTRIPESVLARPAQNYVGLAFDESILIIQTSPAPFLIELYQQGVLQVAANSRSFLHFETTRHRGNVKGLALEQKSDADRHGGKDVIDYGEDGLAIYADGSREERLDSAVVGSEDEKGHWEENFNGHVDKKPKGPMAVGLDFAFPHSSFVYGIPEHASSLTLKTTSSSASGAAYAEPYRMYNLDVFEYELDEPMALYGNIPLMLAHGKVGDKAHTLGVFWFNPSETFVDVSESTVPPESRTQTQKRKLFPESHWMSESGLVDFFLLPGSTPEAVHEQYAALTGTQQLPPIFALGYHQCRWNYRDQKDVATVEGTFEALDFPVDVIWLDIEHTDGKRYFTWDSSLFPTPAAMIQNVSAHGRKMVTIIDPHIKRDDDYSIHKEATQKGLYIKNADGKSDFDGWCWPGSSSYLDFTSATVRQWWAERFGLQKYEGSTLDLFTWNDMNEPSVFNGPEVSMPKDALSLAGVEHREWHNMYGLYMQRATAEGLTLRDPKKELRPFVLSRAFWAGSQRFGAIWTGDNQATWEHLKVAAPMLLSIGLAGLSFCGADVGGFFGEPDAELFTRWFQAGAFTPFFRGHAHHDTRRREPWLFGEPYTSILRSTAMLRYSLLPLWYTVFHEAHSRGLPIMRALFTVFPEDESVWAVDDQWMVGDTLMVKPVTDRGATSVTLHLPGREGWFDLYSLAPAPSQAEVTVSAPLDRIPVFLRGGRILCRKMRLRRSATLMYFDPLTIVVGPDLSGRAAGSLYLDDEKTLKHQSGAFALRSLSFAGGSLVCSADKQSGGLLAPNLVERVIIAGQKAAPTRVSLRTKAVNGDVELRELSFVFDAKSGAVTIKKPDVAVTSDWEIKLE